MPPAPTTRKDKFQMASEKNTQASESSTDLAESVEKYISTRVVYFVSYGVDGPIKIGTTSNLERRIHHLRNACPYQIGVLATLPGGSVTEREIHALLESDRLEGEWFCRSQSVMAIVRFARTNDHCGVRLMERLKQAVASVGPGLSLLPANDLADEVRMGPVGSSHLPHETIRHACNRLLEELGPEGTCRAIAWILSGFSQLQGNNKRSHRLRDAICSAIRAFDGLEKEVSLLVESARARARKSA